MVINEVLAQMTGCPDVTWTQFKTHACGILRLKLTNPQQANTFTPIISLMENFYLNQEIRQHREE